MTNWKTLECGNKVSDCGRVLSRLGRKLSLQKSNAGYLRVELHKNGMAQKHSVHRLVATAFVPNPEGKPQVNHIDGDKTNNKAENLEWVTQSENQSHAYQNGLQRGYRKPAPLSEAHKAALCGSRWRGEKRVYWAGGASFDCPRSAAHHWGVSRQTFYNRAKSSKWPNWCIEVRKEVGDNGSKA